MSNSQAHHRNQPDLRMASLQPSRQSNPPRRNSLHPLLRAADGTEPPAPKPTLQPVNPAIRADVEHYFAHANPGELLLKKDQWKDLPKDLQTLRQLPTAPPDTRAALASQP